MVHVITDFTFGDKIWIRYHAWQEIEKKKLAASSILREAKIAYYARNMFEVGKFFFS